MEKRFSHITEQYKDPAVFLSKLEKLNSKMEACCRQIDNFNENSLSGKIQTVLGATPYKRMEVCRDSWCKLTGQLHPFISDRDGAPAYLSSFLRENRLQSSIHTDFYHIPESGISTAYTGYESDCTLDRSWLVKRDAAVKMEQIIPEKADIWMHISHSGTRQIVKDGISIDTTEDNGRINLDRNLTHYGDMGHVMAALNVGIGYKDATTVFLCDIREDEGANVRSEETAQGYHCCCYLSPEHICAVLSIEDGKIMDACTREEFLKRFQENVTEDYEMKTGREPELERGLDISYEESRNPADNEIEAEEDMER